MLKVENVINPSWWRQTRREICLGSCPGLVPVQSQARRGWRGRDTRKNRPWVVAGGGERTSEGETNLGDGEAPGHDGGEPATRGDPGETR